MKKIFSIFAILVLMCSFATALNEGMITVQATDVEMPSTVVGLQNAILHVRNNETVAHLQDVLSMIEQNRRDQLAKMQQINVFANNGDIELHGVGPVKLLGFISTQYSYTYKINAQTGAATRQHKWYDLFMTGIQE